MRRSLVGGGLFVLAVAACRHDVATSENIDKSSAPLIVDAESIKGDDLGEKELVLTFDDGPGPLDVTGELAEWLSKRPTPIRATFFVNGACIKATTLPNDSCPTPVADADAVLAKIRATGHWVGNHTTTHRDMAKLSGPQVLADIKETDDLIAKHTTFNRLFFRAPYGAWDAEAFNGVKASAMNKYAGPVYWTIGGSFDIAADWACWEGMNGDGTGQKLSVEACGDRYLTEIKSFTKKNGIVLFHDATGDTSNHDPKKAPGNTVDLIKYLIPKLEADGYKFKTLADVPKLAAVLPKCVDADCLECSGAAAKTCVVCAPDKTVTDGTCAAAPSDAGSDADTDAATAASSSSSSSTSSSSSSGEAPPVVAAADEGCNATNRASGGGATAALLALAVALSLRSKRRRS